MGAPTSSTRYGRCATTFFDAFTLAAIVTFWLSQWVLSLECDRRRLERPKA
jgi:hypothetical protein